MDNPKQKLIEKLIEQTDDFEIGELCEHFKIDIYDLVNAAIQSKLETKTVEQLINML